MDAHGFSCFFYYLCKLTKFNGQQPHMTSHSKELQNTKFFTLTGSCFHAVLLHLCSQLSIPCLFIWTQENCHNTHVLGQTLLTVCWNELFAEEFRGSVSILLWSAVAVVHLVAAGAKDLHQHGLIGAGPFHGLAKFLGGVDLRRIQHGNDGLLEGARQLTLQNLLQLLGGSTAPQRATQTHPLRIKGDGTLPLKALCWYTLLYTESVLPYSVLLLNYRRYPVQNVHM